MSRSLEPVTFERRTAGPKRSPAITLVGIWALGIFVDRNWPIPLDAWLILAVIAAVCWLGILCLSTKLVSKSDDTFPGHLSVWFLICGWFCLAGAWHHWRWDCRAADDIANFARDEPQIVRLTGKVAQTPWIIRHQEADQARWKNPERTILVIRGKTIRSDAGGDQRVSGLARVTIDGSLSTVSLGDTIDITGELLRPSEPSNPGDFDQCAYLRTQGITAIVRSQHIESVVVLSHDRTISDWLLIARGAIRRRAERLFESTLGTDTAPVAQAMLLGSRVQIDEETRRAFRESGMLHILAISGMNVGLLWTWIWSLCRWMGRSSRASIWIVLLALPVYAVITDANPPIVRATVVAMIVAFGQMIGRTGSMANALALAGFAVLVWNPSDLFNTGAQLSFLAVFAIIHATRWMTLVHQQAMKMAEDAPLKDSFFRRTSGHLIRSVIEANVVGIAVWTMTSPLIASEFHLVSPIGSLLTVLLIVPVTVMFWIGYSFLFLGLIWSSAFGWLGYLFDLCLRSFLWTVRTGASLELGHVYVPAPPTWWTIGFYGLTLVPILVFHREKLGAMISVRAGMAWMIIGLTWGLLCPVHSGVTCTFISVGHGLGVLIEFPNGRTALYDAGGMIGGGSIARTISQTLWATGRSRLDAVVISHADGDHCNALPELSRIVPPGGLFVHKSFLDWNQPPVAAAIEQSAKGGTKLRLISEGQSIKFDPEVSFRVLHPPHDFHSSKDNPNSLVICLEYAGRRIVLTGDLELEGLEQLLKTPHLDVDVLLSPHHGSLKANPPDLARWATPEYVIVSTPEAATAERLQSRFGPATEILTTARYGAIRCRISPLGELQVEPFKQFKRLVSNRDRIDRTHR